jgi:hypothetical protein
MDLVMVTLKHTRAGNFDQVVETSYPLREEKEVFFRNRTVTAESSVSSAPEPRDVL